ncbi:aspartate aminotransferase family protein [Hypericibacter terrae]|nr:aspartate aminotransferase family protein [Hypericibacter terrae]
MTNADMLERAHAVLPGASLGSFFVPGDADIVVAGGAGPRMTDMNGRDYLDYILGSGPLILGHAHPAVLEAARRQMALGTSYYALNAPSILLAEELVAATPGGEMVKFCSSGSESTFFALRLARAATGRNKVLKFEGGYHGSHDYALMSMAPAVPAAFPTAVPDSAGIPKRLEEEVLIAPFNDIETVADIIERHHDDLAAVILEPEMRLIPPQPGFLAFLREATAKRGIMLVFDEVVMGFRLRYGSVQELYGVKADLVCYGKIIGGGFPLAAVVGPREVMSLSNPRDRAPNYVYISGTLSGNPTAAAAGLATLQELKKPGAYDRLNGAGDRLRAGLGEIARRLNIPARVLGSGPMANIYFTAEPIVDFRSAQREDKPLKQRLRSELMSRGILTNLAQKMYISTAHSAEDIARTLQAVEDSLRALQT